MKRHPAASQGGAKPKFPLDLALIDRALLEDAPKGDVTTLATIPEDVVVTARLVAKGKTVIAGLPLFEAVFKRLDPEIKTRRLLRDGDVAAKGALVAEVTGHARAILTAERVALNYMQHLSGVATLTSQFVAAIKGAKTKILDTRKTTPLMRDMEKYAVRIGGGFNHRRDLSAMALIKENHIAGAGGVGKAVAAARKRLGAKSFVEVEVRDLKELGQALDAGADMVLLDNMTAAMAQKAVRFVDGRVETEASGNMSLKTVGSYARAGVDYISVGALTHSAPAADLSLLVERIPAGKA
ncbi:MAG: carboxylating nicotinate-nucleotide diphosphorylase [Nitrospinae bacterium]|nr:carboxylating nicotinate-nucleotide diphosphorylase [Nitrospinota bacterium]